LDCKDLSVFGRKIALVVCFDFLGGIWLLVGVDGDCGGFCKVRLVGDQED